MVSSKALYFRCTLIFIRDVLASCHESYTIQNRHMTFCEHPMHLLFNDDTMISHQKGCDLKESLQSILHIRGGQNIFTRSFGFVFRRGPKGYSREKYIQDLKDKLEMTDRRLRTCREEACQLRKLLRDQSRYDRQGTSNAIKKSLLTEQELRSQIKYLQELVDQLNSEKLALKELLEVEQNRVLVLDTELQLERQKVIDTERKAKDEIESMKSNILNQSKKELEKFESFAAAELNEETRRLEAEAAKSLEKAMKTKQKELEKERAKVKSLTQKIEGLEKRAERSKTTGDFTDGKKIILGNTQSGSSKPKIRKSAGVRGNRK
mmetsp:Transcript_14713/g.21012  ORF Transcript_14713/g.21012 Transcript_14713/m.21012 type:complete len:321 (-) Transcript_14713:363-1325(-)